MKTLSQKEKKLFALLAVSVVIIIFGFLFLVNAMGIASFFKSFASIPNVLGRYVVVILVMASGMMLFSNVALNFEDKKLRNGLTIGITVFMFILTAPLTYVFFSLMPFAANHNMADVFTAAGLEYGNLAGMTPTVVADSAKVLGLNAIDATMGVHNIYLGFASLFGEGGGLWTILSLMMIVGIVFLLEPVLAAYYVVKGKQLVLFGKNDEGKFKVICVATLPVLRKAKEAEECDGNCECCAHAAEEAAADLEQNAEETAEAKEAAADVEEK